MLERAKPLVTLVGIAGAVGLILAYAGFLEPAVTPARLPGPTVGGVAILALFALAALLPSYIDGLAWKRAGRAVGLTADGSPAFESGQPDRSDKATLGGTVAGRPVRARVYNTNDRRSTTTTVVETELKDPVDWHATFVAGESEETAEDPEIDAAKTHVVDGLTVRGDIPEEIAEAVATRRVEDAVAAADGAVSVGDVTGNFVDDMAEQIGDETDGMAGALAEGLLDATGAGSDGPDRTVKHRNSGLCTNEAELERRVDAVRTVADAVETSH